MSITRKGNQSYEVLWPTDSANELKLQLIRYNSFDIRWTGYPFTLEKKSPIRFVWSQSLTIFKLNVFWWDVVGIPSWWGGVQTVVLGYFKASFKERDRNLISAVFKILTLLNKEIHEGSNFEAFLNTLICRLRVPPPSSLPPPPHQLKAPQL